MYTDILFLAGYLQSFCDILLESLNSLPGDARTQVGFITYDSRIHYYDLSDRQNGSFRVMIAPDLDSKPEDFLPMPDGLMVTLCECRSTVETFLNELPKIYQDNHETDSALGSALQIAGKLLGQTGGRVTVIQTRIPNINPGALNEAIPSGGQAGKEPTTVGPTSDYYKKLSLDYASVQIACDLFLLNSHHIDLATLSMCNCFFFVEFSDIIMICRLYCEVFRWRNKILSGFSFSPKTTRCRTF
jgi:protein transport protein SEC24